MSAPIRIGILGIGGRMGEEIGRALETAEYRKRFRLVASPKRGESLDPLLGSDVVIEFSSPVAALELAEKIAASGKPIPLVVGATGWTEDQNRKLLKIAERTPILRASNFSLGVTICQATLGLWAKWPGIDRWTISIREVHHTRKKDAPSGTALTLAGAIREKLPREVPIESVREGDVVGVHEVTFESASEKMTLVHEAKNRGVFATGALDAAALWVEKSRAKTFPRGLLSLSDLYSD
jgi:4-hydroxy-tetrahydrodipicolinate reductase